MILYIIRHGETINNNIKIHKKIKQYEQLPHKLNIKTSANIENNILNENGYKQCIKIAEYFIGNDNIYIYTSPILRAIQTSDCIKNILKNKIIETYIENVLYESNKTIDKIMSLKKFVNTLYDKYNNTDNIIIIITHNHIIDLFNKMINGINSNKKKYVNGSITIVDIKNRLNENEYIDKNMEIKVNSNEIYKTPILNL